MTVHSMDNYDVLLDAFKHYRWVSVGMVETPLQDMSNSHLFHTIMMLQENLKHKNYEGVPKIRELMLAWLFRLQAEANMRGQLGRID